jgi:hypothetical protein
LFAPVPLQVKETVGGMVGQAKQFVSEVRVGILAPTQTVEPVSHVCTDMSLIAHPHLVSPADRRACQV